MLGKHVGEALAGCEHVAIGCAGGLSELPYITARTVLCNDLNRHAINLGMCIADEAMKDEVVRRLGALLVHPDVLEAAQRRCREQELFAGEFDVASAALHDALLPPPACRAAPARDDQEVAAPARSACSAFLGPHVGGRGVPGFDGRGVAVASLTIDMNPREAKCWLCGDWTAHRWGVPTFNGDLVSNDFPDELWRAGGGGQAACERCYSQHARGELMVCDRFYLHLLGGLVDGAGI